MPEETALEIYNRKVAAWGRQKKVFEDAFARRKQELDDELAKAQAVCNPHIDNGAPIYGHCTKCGYFLG